jgi:uncharacterized membrane protein YuzA (DUF378 family)
MNEIEVVRLVVLATLAIVATVGAIGFAVTLVKIMFGIVGLAILYVVEWFVDPYSWLRRLVRRLFRRAT